MANLIITVIAIALVAVASLMGAYYGGSAFLNNQSAANAASAMNSLSQMAGAWNAYRGDNIGTTPTSLTMLTQGNYINSSGYLQAIPLIPGTSGGVAPFPAFVASATATVNGVSGLHYFGYADLGRPAAGATPGFADTNASACVRVQKTAMGRQPTAIASAAQAAIFQSGNGTFGCAILTGTVAGGLGSAAVPAGDLQTGDYVMEYLLQ